jgi:gas vesicle protein
MISFIAGVLVGGIVGVFITALLQTNRAEDEREEKLLEKRRNAEQDKNEF